VAEGNRNPLNVKVGDLVTHKINGLPIEKGPKGYIIEAHGHNWFFVEWFDKLNDVVRLLPQTLHGYDYGYKWQKHDEAT